MGEGIEIAAPIDGDVAVVGLEHQKGNAEVVFTGELYGTTVALRTTIDEGRSTRDYLTIYGYLQRIGAGVTVGGKLDTGNVLGAASDSGQAASVTSISRCGESRTERRPERSTRGSSVIRPSARRATRGTCSPSVTDGQPHSTAPPLTFRISP